MKVRDIMTTQVVRICPQESAGVAARTLERYNIGALPVCGLDGRLCGMLTDRDLAVRCIASGRTPETAVGELMTRQVISVSPDTDAGEAARIMGHNQVRRLPVMENGALCGIVSLSDLSASGNAAQALESISSGLSRR